MEGIKMMISTDRRTRMNSANSLLFCLVILVLSSCSNAEVENQLREDLSVVERERDNAIDSTEKLKQDLISLEAEYNTLSEDLDSVVNKGNTVQENLESTTVELYSLQDKLLSTVEERDNLLEVRDQLQNDLDSTKASRDVLQTSLDSINIERDELLIFNEDLKGRISGLQDELRQLQGIFLRPRYLYQQLKIEFKSYF